MINNKKKIKGIILAGGLGSRLYPLTHVTNKHLLPVFNKPMIYYPIQTFIDAGIEDIIIVVGGPHAGHFVNLLKDGNSLGIKNLKFVYQEEVIHNGKRCEGGIAHALSLCEKLVDGDNIAVILGDNTMDMNISEYIKDFENGSNVFIKKVDDPQRYGVPVFDKINKNKIIKIEEKPKKPKSKYAITGLYLYDNTVFDKIRKLKPSKRGEIEITDLNNLYIKENNLYCKELMGFWTDAGTFDSLFLANKYWADKNNHK